MHNLGAGPQRLFPALLICFLLAAIACGKVSSTETPVPFFSPTPFPTAITTATPLPTATTEPTLVPTRPPRRVAEPITMAVVASEHLPSIVLTLAQVQAEFPGLPLDPDDTGYQDNEAAAEFSLDPDDTGPDLAARGRLDGYQASFFDSAGLFGGSPSRDGPIAAEFAAELFNSSGAAQGFIRHVVQVIRRLQGGEIEEGITLNQFAPFTAPGVGADALAGRYSVSLESLDIEIFVTFIVWRRDNLVLTTLVIATDDMDWAAPAQRLAHLMEQRLDGVLEGTVRGAPTAPPVATRTPFATTAPSATAVPIATTALIPTPLIFPTPAPTASIGRSGQAGGISSAALPAMLPTLADLAPGTFIELDGYVQATDALSAYEREFVGEGLFFTFGQSQLISLSSTVELYATSSEASEPVRSLLALDPQVFAQLFGGGVAQGFGTTPENVEVEEVDLPPIGDASMAVVIRIQEAEIDLDAYWLWFAQGQIAAELIAVGPPGQIHLVDLVTIAQLVDQRIRAEAP